MITPEDRPRERADILKAAQAALDKGGIEGVVDYMLDFCDAMRHDIDYRYDDSGASYTQIDTLHGLVHPFRKNEGVYRENNPSGCDKFWCMHFVPAFAAALQSRLMKIVPMDREDITPFGWAKLADSRKSHRFRLRHRTPEIAVSDCGKYELHGTKEIESTPFTDKPAERCVNCAAVR